MLSAGLYVVLYLAFENYVTSTAPEPLPEGAPVEWVELGEVPMGQPSSSPEGEALPAKTDVVAALPAPEPPAREAETASPAPQASSLPDPAPATVAPLPIPTESYESPENLKEAWTDPHGDWAVDAAAEAEAAEAMALNTLTDEDFFEPQQQETAVSDLETAENPAAAYGARDTDPVPQPVMDPPPAVTESSLAGSAAAHQGPTNPFMDPDAPPMGRHGVLDARSLRAAGGNPPPAYPTSDRLARREGVVVLLGYVTSDGNLLKVTVEKEASSAMTQESYRTFKSYRYRPGQTGWVRQTFKFTLRGDPQEIPGTLRGA